MWEQYKKSAPYMQAFVVVVTAVFFFVTGRNWLAAVIIFLTMQVAALLGAWWGARIKRKIIEQDEGLPLRRDR